MKKILFTSIVLAQTCLAFGQNGLTVFTPSAENGGLQGLAISENGKYICGSLTPMTASLRTLRPRK